jgi:GTP-binding protein EngB required for normal cell division
VTPRAPLGQRLKALNEAVTLSRGRADEKVVEAAAAVVQRAGQRVAFSGDHTVVALAGATGSGKSSAFNALSRTELAKTGARRPTTGQAMAVAWGTHLPHDLLDWLEVPSRHLVASGATELQNLILIDLPDHDSVEVTHRMTVDRLVELVDMLVWIVDPQKYADAALHERYLKPLAPYAEVMIVVLNQTDRLWGDELERCLADLRRLLDSEGLAATPIMSMSATEGIGVPEVRKVLAKAVADKRAVTRRLSADVDLAARALQHDLGAAPAAPISQDQRLALTDSLADAAGVPIVVQGVREAWRRRGAFATGWPFVSWLSKLRPDPLRAIRLDQKPRELSPTAISRTSLPAASSVQKARVDRALRELVDAAGAGLPRGWAEAVRSAARDHESRLLDRLDLAIAGADLRLDRGNGWWSVVRLLQWLLIGVALAGLAWVLAALFAPSLQFPPLPDVRWWGVPAPWTLLGGGIGGGLLLAAVSRVGVAIGAGLKARSAEGALQHAVMGVIASDIIAPVEAELERYRGARTAVAGAA